MLEQIAPAMSLKAEVCRQISCPCCNSILDVRRAVEVVVELDSDRPFIPVLCARCFDERWPTVMEKTIKPEIAKLRAWNERIGQAVLPGTGVEEVPASATPKSWSVDIHDGRTMDWSVLAGVLR